MVAKNNKKVNGLNEVLEQFPNPPGNETLNDEEFIYLSIDIDGEFHIALNPESNDEINEFDVGVTASQTTRSLFPKLGDKFPTFASAKESAISKGDKDRYRELVHEEKKQLAALAKTTKERLKEETEEKKRLEKISKSEEKEIENQLKDFLKKNEKDIAKSQKEQETLKKEEAKLFASRMASDEPSPELLYATTLSSMPNLAVEVLDENVKMYEWIGSYWSGVSDHDGKAQAFEWLSQSFPAITGNKLAQNAYQSALFKVKSLPPKPTEAIIPLTNAWLFVTDDGKFIIKNPDKAWGVTYNIRAALNYKQGDEFYSPHELPVDSMFSKYLSSSLPDKEERDLVQEFLGSTLIPSVKFQTAQIWEGDGSNGKSILLHLITQLHQKTIAVELDDMENFELAPLRDASLAISAETPKGSGKINENMLKKCIAGDLIKIKNKFESSYNYNPTAKWIMACNRFPKIQDDSNGVFRRLQYIRWNVEFAGDAIIPDLHKLIAEKELAIVLDWCLIGLSRLLARGKFDPPESVTKRNQEQKVIGNSVLAYVNETEYRIDPVGAQISKDELYANYKEFCETSGITVYGGVEFWIRIKSIFKDLKETQKRVQGKKKRYVNLTAKPLQDEVQEQGQIAKAF